MVVYLTFWKDLISIICLLMNCICFIADVRDRKYCECFVPAVIICVSLCQLKTVVCMHYPLCVISAFIVNFSALCS